MWESLQTAVMAAIGGVFGLSKLQSVRAGLLLAAGGEFAFVTFQGQCVLAQSLHAWLGHQH